MDLHAKSWLARVTLPGIWNECLRIQTESMVQGQVENYLTTEARRRRQRKGDEKLARIAAWSDTG